MLAVDVLDWLQVAALATVIYCLGGYMSARKIRRAFERYHKEGRR